MATETLRPLAEFDVRSIVTHALMAASLLGAVGSAFLLDGRLGLVSFVAFLNFTAGLWVSQSVHSLGHALAGGDYDGVLSALRRRLSS